MKINHPLYFIVFGESLFNDAVVIVMYNVVQTPGVTFGRGFLDFLKVFFVAMIVGLVIGIITIFISHYTHKFRDSEPVVAVAMGYLSYVLAEYFGLSGIVSMTIYGLIYSEYISMYATSTNLTFSPPSHHRLQLQEEIKHHYCKDSQNTSNDFRDNDFLPVGNRFLRR